MSILETAKAFFAKAKDMAKDILNEEVKTLPSEVRAAYYDLEKKAYFSSDNEVPDSRREHLSPSGKYKLVTSGFGTKPGCWSYTQGQVFEQGSDTPIATIQRNYSSFPFNWIEDHPNGHAYLIGGEDYQGQTVIELDTGKRRDSLPEAANKGWGFCWTGTTFDKGTSILVADGCFWACPYEFRFYDFSDPMGTGWPEIEVEDSVDVDRKAPTFEADGTIVCYQSEYINDDEDDDDADEDGAEKKPEERPVAATQTFRREDMKLVLQSEWVSEKEQQKRAAREEAQRKYEAEMADFKANDPLYLAFMAHLKDPAFSQEESLWSGVTHDTWCPDFKVYEPRIGKRIFRDNTQEIEIEWARKTGPVKLILHKDGKRENKFWMEHSVESIEAAFAYAREFLTGVPDAGG
jgi:uncharacterized Zn finger protein (UPF0148 family)